MNAFHVEHLLHERSADARVGARQRVEGVEGHKATPQRFAQPEDELDGLEGLDAAHDAGQHAEHAGLGARRGEFGGRRPAQTGSTHTQESPCG